MNILVIFLVCLVFFIGIAILVHKSGVFGKPEPVKGFQTEESNQQQQVMNQYAPQPVWGAPDYLGSCNVYTFLGGQFTPAAPSYSTVNQGGRGYYVNKWPNEIPQTCIDTDQLFVQGFTHECNSSANNSAGAGCILTIPTYDTDTQTVKQPGDIVPPGVTEGTADIPVYGQCVPSNLANNQGTSPYCIGSIGVIIPNFTPQVQPDNTGTAGNVCLNGLYGQTGGLLAGSQGSIGYYNLESVQCDLTEPGQIFRVVKYSLQSDGSLKQDDTGNLASITHRYTGYYLAPQLNIDTTLDENDNVVYTYDFLNPIYTYGDWTDQAGETGYVSMPLVLVPPSYDKTRQGVYWLFKNETLNAQYYNSNITEASNYKEIGIMPGQTNFTARFPNAPSGVSYFTYLAANQFPSIAPVDLYVVGSQGGCYFNTSVGAGGETGVSNVLSGIAPQQIAYIPDLRLLPDISSTTDPSRIWSYLINTYTINVRNDKVAFLTPYRKNSFIDIWFGCAQDPNDSSNVFTELLGAVKSVNPPNAITRNTDTQFIDYISYGSEILKPVGNGIINGIETVRTFPGSENAADQMNPLETAIISIAATRLVWLLFFA